MSDKNGSTTKINELEYFKLLNEKKKIVIDFTDDSPDIETLLDAKPTVLSKYLKLPKENNSDNILSNLIKLI